nr:zinc finger BED domain-containing protein 4-like [Paramormyrops kingsleyae]
MSLVWRYFSLETPKSKTATCNVCKASVPRGGSTVASYNTTNLIKHLQRFHDKEYQEFMLANREKDTRQQTLVDVFQKRNKFTADNPKAKAITEKLLNFIILDDQPLSVVENVGFSSLLEHLEPRYNLPSRKYISETAIPELYNRVSSRLAAQLENVKAMSFTTDIWTSDVSPMSLISLTVHWVNSESYALQSAVLQVKKCRGSHTSSTIATSITEMLKDWKIQLAKVHVIVRDNASNMKKAMEEIAVPSLGCFAHTLQLVVHEGLISQRSVSDAIANARKIVGHFKHSQIAQSRLEDIQTELKLPTNRLRQDVQTRWNSSFYMIQSLLEQKRALCAYAADHNLPVTLSANEWALLEKTVTVLEPFEELTRNISSATSTTADAIPAITVLKRLLSKESSTDSGIKTMKSTLLQAVDRRFSSIESGPLYSVATLLDPRYKDRYFTGEDTAKHAKAALIQEMEKDRGNTAKGFR